MSAREFFPHLTVGVTLLSLIMLWPSTAGAEAITFSASGATPAGIQTTVDSYRAALGTLNPNVAGSFGSGRREINWDGVPNALAAPNLLPANFFNANSPRGVVFSTPGAGFEVSANAAIAPIEFDTINPTYSSTAFRRSARSGCSQRLAATSWTSTFLSPARSTPATVSGFGAVFTDVDLAEATSLQFFAANGASLGSFSAASSEQWPVVFRRRSSTLESASAEYGLRAAVEPWDRTRRPGI